MTVKRGFFSLVCLPADEGGLLTIGGFNDQRVDVVEHLPTENAPEWKRLAPLPLPLSSRGGVYFKRRVLVVGGRTLDGALTSAMYAFQFPTAGGSGQWVTLKQRLPSPDYSQHITVCGDTLFLCSTFPHVFIS